MFKNAVAIVVTLFQIIRMENRISVTQTRRRTAHFALSQPSDLPSNMLPLESDIFNKYRKMKEENSNATHKDMAKALAEEVMNFWESKGESPYY